MVMSPVVRPSFSHFMRCFDVPYGSLSAISARHYHQQRDVVASRDVGVSPAIKLNPERGDYETLVVSRNILSGSTKLTLNPERGDYETLVVSRSVLSGSTKLMFNHDDTAHYS